MKQIIYILIFFVGMTSFAQRDGQMKERIRAQKTAFITDRLSLTAEEAQQFWPIYNAFEAKAEAIKNGDLLEIKMKMRRGNVSETEADELLKKLLSAENELHDAKIDLVNDLKKVISSEKIIKLKAAEDAFNKVLLEKLREFRNKRQPRN